MHFAAHAGRVLPNGTIRLSVSNYHQVTGLFPGAVGIPRAYTLADDGDRRNADVPRQRIDHFKTILNLRHRTGSAGRIEADLGFQMNMRREESFPHVHGLGPRPEGTLAHGLDLRTGTLNLRHHRMWRERWRTVAGVNAQVQENGRSGFEFILGDFRTMQAGVFALAEHSPKENMVVQFGLRGDMGRVTVDPFLMPVYASPTEIIGEVERGPAADQRMAAPSGSVGISWSPGPAWKLKTNLSRSFRFVTAPELAMNGVHHGTFRHEVGDPSLGPERGWQLDGGAYFRRKVWGLSFTPFAYLFDNYIFLRPTAAFSPLPEAGQLYRCSQTRAAMAGGELEVSWQAHAHLEIAQSVEYVANQNLENGLALPFTPPLLARSSFTYTIVDKEHFDLRLFGEVVASAAQERTDRNELPTPGYVLANAGLNATRTFGRQQLVFMFHVRNIGDTPYLMHLSRYRILNLPEPGRNLMLTLRYVFGS
jgi:iron complex outermembrane receptor protein